MDPIDSKTRRKLRQKLGSRVARRAGTKMRARKGGGLSSERPRAKLAKLIAEYLAHGVS